MPLQTSASEETSTYRVFARRLAAAIVLQAATDLGKYSLASKSRPGRKAKADAIEFLNGPLAKDIAVMACIPPKALRDFALARSREMRQEAALKAAVPVAADVREVVSC